MLNLEAEEYCMNTIIQSQCFCSTVQMQKCEYYLNLQFYHKTPTPSKIFSFKLESIVEVVGNIFPHYWYVIKLFLIHLICIKIKLHLKGRNGFKCFLKEEQARTTNNPRIFYHLSDLKYICQ